MLNCLHGYKAAHTVLQLRTVLSKHLIYMNAKKVLLLWQILLWLSVIHELLVLLVLIDKTTLTSDDWCRNVLTIYYEHIVIHTLHEYWSNVGQWQEISTLSSLVHLGLNNLKSLNWIELSWAELSWT